MSTITTIFLSCHHQILPMRATAAAAAAAAGVELLAAVWLPPRAAGPRAWRDDSEKGSEAERKRGEEIQSPNHVVDYLPKSGPASTLPS